MAAKLPAPPIPQQADELTPEWLTSALRARGVLQQARVCKTDCDVLGEGEGFVGQVLRLRLELDRPEPGAPETLIAKFPISLATNRTLGASLGLYEREIRFYDDLAERVPLATPRCYWSAMDPHPLAGHEERALRIFDRIPLWLARLLLRPMLKFGARDSRRYLILLEDLAPARVGDQVAGCDAARAEQALRALARLHAAFWGDDALPAHLYLPANRLRNFTQAAFLRTHRGFLRERSGDSAQASLAPLALWLERNGRRVLDHLSRPPRTLVHGDYRLDNLFFTPGEGDGGRHGVPDEFAAERVTAIDWQGAGQARGPIDAAYFVTGNVAPEVAGRCEGDLLAAYHAELVERGVRDYPPEACRRDYEIAKVFIAYRLMMASDDLIDLSHERGVRLMARWWQRLEALLPEDPQALLEAAGS